MSDGKVGDALVEWARNEPSVRVLILIGSRARGLGSLGSADEGSDWDFQVVTSQPQLFVDRTWTALAGLSNPLAYVLRPGRLGRINKVSAVFPEGALDLALVPEKQLRFAKRLSQLRLLPVFPPAQRALSELATVLFSGYRFLKGTRGWQTFFYQIASKVTPQRLSDDDVCALADGYVCDYVSTRWKIARGELLAAQRWLHCQLADSNFRFLHELKLRLNEVSFPDARRIEQLGTDDWYRRVSVAARPEKNALLDAVELSAQTCRDLVRALVGAKWRWPDLPLPLR